MVGSVVLASFCLDLLPLARPGLTQSPVAIGQLNNSPKAIVDEAWQVVHRHYVDRDFNQVDWVKTRHQLLSRRYSNHQQAYAAIRGALQPLNDPYTRFMDPQQFRQLTVQTAGELTGVGIMILNDAQTGRPFIVKTLKNSPAERSGLQVGDWILSVDGRSTVAMEAQAVASLIRGEPNSKVKLEISRTGVPAFQVEIAREIIQVQTVQYQMKQAENRRIGYIRVTEFSSHAAEQMANAIQVLTRDRADAFVLDLRGNPGGLFEACIDIAQMWLNQGMIVRTVDRTGKSERFFARQSALTNRPVVVLVDQNSASSSEILTGALQDNRRAVVVGTKTFGKALVQAVHQLADGSGLAVTVAHYYTPKGTDISRKGITPDFTVPLSQAQAFQLKSNSQLLTTNLDAQYQRAVEILSQHLSQRSQEAVRWVEGVPESRSQLPVSPAASPAQLPVGAI
ncbi:S41 family peptidase [Lyngbya confervoides]|uniref:S41 family peptidase n=1 Tax=Lyngbya confervoides BDU141951 TaxID=1574623 RepID=A0ABD4T494_9CYAN|nr:S41 family peptidase [Lyngbya confervoides]MCM1983537.1 S41 family peptidase [Lyngbya confervoides BDU141951]